MTTRKPSRWQDALDDPGPHLTAMALSGDLRHRLAALFAAVAHPDLSDAQRSAIRDACRELAAEVRERGPVNVGGVVYRCGPAGGLECRLPWGDEPEVAR